MQRRLKIGYNRAARLLEAMETAGLVGPLQSNGAREVLAPPPPRGLRVSTMRCWNPLPRSAARLLAGVLRWAQRSPRPRRTPLDPYLDDLQDAARAASRRRSPMPQGREIDRATGTLLVSRPGQVPLGDSSAVSSGGSTGAGQLLVADGTQPVVLRS